ncbi:MAG: T9SS type A sorting domain-containing protein [Bacteroidetes bacterium]|nr:T9SS type A sorting domain-containing protein [Bacteroidota bacterium]
MNGHPNLDWEENTEPDLLQYRIYRDGEQIAITTSTFYTDNDVTIYAPIYQIDYFVKAEDTDFNLSVASETESVMGFIHKSSEDDKEKNRLPKEYVLEQNYPNPFNPTSKISYSIQKDGLVSLKVYDILGKEVASLVNEPKIAGTYNIEFNASNLPSGIYFYRIQTGTFIDTKKLILLK